MGNHGLPSKGNEHLDCPDCSTGQQFVPTAGQLPGQPKVNPKGHINAVFTKDEWLVESPVMVLQEIALVPATTEPFELQNRGNKGLEGRTVQSPPLRPYQPPIPYPQTVAKSKLEPRFVRFLYLLRKIYVDTPFLESLKEAPSICYF